MIKIIFLLEILCHTSSNNARNDIAIMKSPKAAERRSHKRNKNKGDRQSEILRQRFNAKCSGRRLVGQRQTRCECRLTPHSLGVERSKATDTGEWWLEAFLGFHAGLS